MKTQTKKIAVIYANESNIWDPIRHRFDFFRESANIDEMSYAMHTQEAEELLIQLKKEYPYAYIIDCSPEEEEI